MKKKILLVLNDFDECRNVSNFLEVRGYKVSCSRFGETAMLKLRNQAFDCVVVECELPDMSGYDVVRNLRDRKVSCGVVAITRGDCEKGADGLEVWSVLRRPLDLETLSVKVAEALEFSSVCTEEALQEDLDILREVKMKLEQKE